MNKKINRIIIIIGILIIVVAFLILSDPITSLPVYIRIIGYIIYGLILGVIVKLVNK